MARSFPGMMAADSLDFRKDRRALLLSYGLRLAGLGFSVIIPVEALSWLFIPTVVNAAAAGGDFMAVSWLYRQDRTARFHDDGDILTAYVPTSQSG